MVFQPSMYTDHSCIGVLFPRSSRLMCIICGIISWYLEPLYRHDFQVGIFLQGFFQKIESLKPEVPMDKTEKSFALGLEDEHHSTVVDSRWILLYCISWLRQSHRCKNVPEWALSTRESFFVVCCFFVISCWMPVTQQCSVIVVVTCLETLGGPHCVMRITFPKP
jgi:hypothetical protein